MGAEMEDLMICKMIKFLKNKGYNLDISSSMFVYYQSTIPSLASYKICKDMGSKTPVGLNEGLDVGAAYWIERLYNGLNLSSIDIPFKKDKGRVILSYSLINKDYVPVLENVRIIDDATVNVNEIREPFIKVIHQNPVLL